MSRTYKGVYVDITPDDRRKVAELLEYAQDSKRLADWLQTTEKTILGWAKDSKQFRIEACERIELLHKECIPLTQTAKSVSLLRIAYDKARMLETELQGTGHTGLAHALVADLAILLVEQGEA